MKAIGLNQYGPPEVLKEMFLPEPQAGDNEVIVRVHATSVNPLDWKIRKKAIPVKSMTGFPRVLGYDVSGVVESAGRDVKHLKVGDDVYGMVDYRRDGANAELLRTRDAFLNLKPKTLSHQEAAAVPLAALTALQGLKLKAKMKEGDRVLITGGSGGVGHFAVQIAKGYGAYVATTCSEQNAEFVKGLGADEVYCYDLDQEPDEGADFDVIFDTVGSKRFTWSKKRLTKTGCYVSTEPDPGGLAATKLGKWVGKKQRCEFVMVTPDHHGLRYLAEMIDEGGIRPAIQKVYSLDDLADAHRESEAGHVVGKLVVDVIGSVPDPDEGV